VRPWAAWASAVVLTFFMALTIASGDLWRGHGLPVFLGGAVGTALGIGYHIGRQETHRG
jgi:hypothetical protein